MVAASQYTPVRPRIASYSPPQFPLELGGAYYWDQDSLYESPAVQSRSFTWIGTLQTAVLSANIYLNPGNTLTEIYFNNNLLSGSSGSDGAHRDYDVKPFFQQGVNEVRITFSGIIIPWFPSGYAVVLVKIVADKILEIKDPRVGLKWTDVLLYGGLAVAGIGVTAYLVSSLKGKGSISIAMPSYVSRTVTKTRKKIGRKISGD